jgi:hypothetical protein
MGMIGGGEGAFIGGVHRIAAALDQQVDLIAGVFPELGEQQRNRRRLFLDAAAVYRSYEEMAERESQLPADRRIDFVVIVTPNHAHFALRKRSSSTGFMSSVTSADDHSRRGERADATRRAHRLCSRSTYNYTGYPLVRHARIFFRSVRWAPCGKFSLNIGKGGWCSRKRSVGSRQAAWRTNPQSRASAARSATSAHALHLANTHRDSVV